jgi:hypothetical protein
MKRTSTISVFILLAVMAGCGGGKQSTDDFEFLQAIKQYL